MYSVSCKLNAGIQVLALLDFVSRGTVVAQAYVVRHRGRRQQAQLSPNPLHGSMPNFVRTPLSAISPHYFIYFKIFNYQIFTIVFVHMGPNGSQNFKMLVLPQITLESFQTFSEFSSQWSSQKYCFGFLKF